MYEFKKEYEIGVKEIDSEHRQFFAYLNSAVDALDLPDEQAVKSATELLDVLMAYAAKHFKHEEAYMRRTNSPELAPQIDEHLRFKKTIASMTERKGEMSRQDLGTLFVFMAKWLREHILTADMRISHDMPVLAMTPDFHDRHRAHRRRTRSALCPRRATQQRDRERDGPRQIRRDSGRAR